MKFIGLVTFIIGGALLLVTVLLFVPLLIQILSGSIHFNQITQYPSLAGQYVFLIFGLLCSFIGYKLMHTPDKLSSQQPGTNTGLSIFGVVLITVFVIFFCGPLLLLLILSGG